MIAALEQARFGRGSCAPNPSVGAVLVHNDKVIAQDWHRGAGHAHAEQRVLKNFPAPKDSVLYVTLEPCNHWGRTPPCVKAIIDAGIAAVVYAYRDPNPLVAANNTPHILKEAGVDVIYFPLEEINEFYKSYHYWITHKKPWVTAKIAHSFDGMIADSCAERLYLTNSLCNEFTHQQRQTSDIIVTSAATIIADDPLLNVRLEECTISKPLALIDRAKRVKNEAAIFSNDRTCLIYYDENAGNRNLISNACYYPMPVFGEKIDLSLVIGHLGTLGYHDVWVEAGATLFSMLHQLQLVNTTYIYLAPTIVGKTGVPGYRYPIFTHKHTLSWIPKADNMIACIQWPEVSCLQE